MDGQQQGAESAKQVVMQTVQDSGIPPQVYVQLGDMAEAVLRDKALYPQFADQMIKIGVADPEDFTGKVDYQILISMIAMGRVCREMIQPQAGAA